MDAAYPDHDDLEKTLRESKDGSVLKIQSVPFDNAVSDLMNGIDDMESGRDVNEHVINFEAPNELRQLMTEKRQELIEYLLKYGPSESIRSLAESLGRGHQEVLDDLKILEDFEIVEYETDGQRKKPFIPYSDIDIIVRYSAPIGKAREGV